MNFEKARRLLSFLRRAVDDYEMIKDGDRIADEVRQPGWRL